MSTDLSIDLRKRIVAAVEKLRRTVRRQSSSALARPARYPSGVNHVGFILSCFGGFR